MAKLTKTQAKRLVESIRSKAFKLFGHDMISMRDYDAISKIMVKAKNRMK